MEEEETEQVREEAGEDSSEKMELAPPGGRVTLERKGKKCCTGKYSLIHHQNCGIRFASLAGISFSISCMSTDFWSEDFFLFSLVYLTG